MAKLGPQQGGYDPFGAIATSLTQLKEGDEAPAARTAPGAPPISRPSIEPKPGAPVPQGRGPEPAPRASQPGQALRAGPAPGARFAPASAPYEGRLAARPAAADEEPDVDSGGGVEEASGAQRGRGGVHPDHALRTTKRFKTTKTEAQRHDQATVRLAAKLGIAVDFSKVTRALWEVYLRHEEDILKQVKQDGTWERPANTDAVGLAELDEKLAEIIGEGLMVAAMRPRNRR